MKHRAFGFALAVCAALAASPRTAAEEAHRIVEAGFDLDVVLANNLVGLNDVFNAHKAVVLDLRKVLLSDITAGLRGEAGFFINVNTKTSWSFGIFAGVEGVGQFWASEDLLRLLKEGNVRTRSIEGSLSAGAGAFASAGVKAVFPLKGLRITLRPAVYMPLFYIPPPDFSYAINMDEETGSIQLRVGGGVDLYSAVSLEDGASMDLFGDGSPLLGADLSTGVEYALLPICDVGVTLTHIPVVPSSLNHRARLGLEEDPFTYEIADEKGGVFGALTENSLELPDFKTKTTYDDHSLIIFRPLRLDLFAEYRPLGVNLFVIRPSLGLSFLTIYGGSHVSFNFALEGRINLADHLLIGLSTALREEIYRQTFSLGLNFRVVEFTLGLSLAGTDFFSSFNGRGVGAQVGLRFGY